MARIVPCIRKISTSSLLRDSMTEPLKQTTTDTHAMAAKTWKNLFFFVCVPAIGVAFLNANVSEEEHPPEFIKYTYLRIRRKVYPWRDGVKSLFHNPHRNALPDGYEAELH